MTFAGQDGARLGGEVFHAKSRSQNPLALLCDLVVLLVLSAVTRLVASHHDLNR